MAKKGVLTKSDYIPYDDFLDFLNRLEAAKEYRYCAYCAASFAFALRVSDMRLVRWEDFIGRKTLRVQEKKTGKTRTITISQSTQDKLSRLHAKLGCPEGTILQNKDGAPVSEQYINRHIKQLAEKHGLCVEHLSTHSFRKTFGRHVYDTMGQTDHALLLLQQIFRHHDSQTTAIYLGLRDEEIKSVYNYAVF